MSLHALAENEHVSTSAGHPRLVLICQPTEQRRPVFVPVSVWSSRSAGAGKTSRPARVGERLTSVYPGSSTAGGRVNGGAARPDTLASPLQRSPPLGAAPPRRFERGSSCPSEGGAV